MRDALQDLLGELTFLLNFMQDGQRLSNCILGLLILGIKIRIHLIGLIALTLLFCHFVASHHQYTSHDALFVLYLDDLVVKLGDFAHSLDLLEGRWSRQIRTDEVMLTHEILVDQLETLYLFHEIFDIHLLYCFLPGHIDFLHFCPIHLDVEGPQPVIKAVLQVSKEPEMLLSNFPACRIQCKCALGHSYLIPILIVRAQEEVDEREQQREQSAHI